MLLPRLISEIFVPSVMDIFECESFSFAIDPAYSSFVIPESLIVTAPSVTEKLSVENEAIPLLVALASSPAIVTVPLFCVMSIPSLAVKVRVSPRLISEELLPSVTAIFECESFAFAIEPASSAFEIPEFLIVTHHSLQKNYRLRMKQHPYWHL